MKITSYLLTTLSFSITQIDWSKNGKELHNFIRGLDSSPGATTFIKPQTKDGVDENSDVSIEIKFFGSSLWEGEYETEGDKLYIPGLSKPAVIHDAGLLITANDGVKVSIENLLNTKLKLIKNTIEIRKKNNKCNNII